MENPSLQIGDNNWAVKDGSILGYNIIQDNYLPQPIDFTRASSATRVNAAGLIESVATGVPRIDYTTGSPALLLEPQRTNLALYSEQFDNAAWVKFNATITANDAISPDGTTNADKLTENATNSIHLTGNNSVSITNGLSYSFSVFAKKAERNVVQIAPSSTYFGLSAFVNFDLQNGVISASGGSPVKTSITSFNNDWYKCEAVFNATQTGSGSVLNIVLANSPTMGRAAAYPGDGTSGVYIYGAQLEQGSYPTSYIPTTSTAVTRVADRANNTAASAFVGLSSGTIYLDLYQEIKSGELDILSINNASTNYLLRCRLNGNSLSFAYNGGVGGTNLAANVDLINNSRNKIAIKYNAATKVSRTYFNGVFHSTTTGANAYPVLAQNNILIGPWFGTSYMQLQGLMLFTTELSDADLIALTTL